jgi:soluble P-type ATPase
MKIDIPGKKPFELKNIVFDYNGTIAIDGKVIKGVSENINELAGKLNFYVVTADTYGSVEKELAKTNCKIIKIPKSAQDLSKLYFVTDLGSDITLAVGNGRNDKLMLKEAVLGIGILQEEGICTETLLNSDIVVKSILDVFGYLKETNRLIATLRN